MMSPNPAYPGLAILENTWSLAEIEQEARAQIEMALKNIPQISHISGHMGSTGFDPEVDINGIDLSRYPISRTFSVGLNFNF